MNELFFWLVIAVFGFVMLIGIWQVYDNYYVFNHALDDSVLKYKPDPNDPSAVRDSPITDDMVGWITIDDTNIDYPVMQGESNSHFLNTDPFGKYSLSGSIFLDSRCSSDFSDSFSLIYGHHMEYGKMFGALDDFLNRSFLEKHKKGTLMVGRNAEKVYEIEVFAAMKVSAKEKTVFDLDQDRIRQYIRDNAQLSGGIGNDRILALSTCADADSVSRIAVFCYIR